MTQNRRQFLSRTAAMAGGGWLWLQLPALATMAACARDAASRNDPFNNLGTEAGNAMRALAARIIPSVDGLPGADEAGAAWFVDSVIAGPFASEHDLLDAGLADLDVRARAAHSLPFAELAPEQQDTLIREIEDTPFFSFARFATIVGTFSHPSYGGNRNHAGFRMLGVDHAPAYQPPFGWYDEHYTESTGPDI